MNCEEAKKLLALAAGGDLEEQEQETLDAHLASCGTCRGLLERYRADRELMWSLRRAGPRPPEFAQFWAGIRDKLKPEFRRRRVHVVLHRAVRAVTVAAVLLIAITFIWHRDTGGPGEVPSPGPQEVSGPFFVPVEPEGGRQGQEMDLEECELCVDTSRVFDF